MNDARLKQSNAPANFPLYAPNQKLYDSLIKSQFDVLSRDCFKNIISWPLCLICHKIVAWLTHSVRKHQQWKSVGKLNITGSHRRNWRKQYHDSKGYYRKSLPNHVECAEELSDRCSDISKINRTSIKTVPETIRLQVPFIGIEISNNNRKNCNEPVSERLN